MSTQKYKNTKIQKHVLYFNRWKCFSVLRRSRVFLCFCVKGFTLIETIIYIAIIGLVISGFVFFSLTISDSRTKTYVTQEVQANARIAMEMVTQKIRSASGVNTNRSTFSSDPGLLFLVMSEFSKNPTIINLDQDDGTLMIREGRFSPAVPVTSDEVKVTNLVFTDLTPSDGPANIRVEMTIEYDNPDADIHYSASQDLQTTVSLRQ